MPHALMWIMLWLGQKKRNFYLAWTWIMKNFSLFYYFLCFMFPWINFISFLLCFYLKFSILGRRWKCLSRSRCRCRSVRSFWQLQSQCIMHKPTDEMTVIMNGTKKKLMIIDTCVRLSYDVKTTVRFKRE